MSDWMDSSTATRLRHFKDLKHQCLCKKDLSRKGSIDEPIRQLVDAINANEYYYTTSTCSGRISLIEKPQDDAGCKKGGSFLLNCHEPLQIKLFHDILQDYSKQSDRETCLWLKFEPFILHVQCFDLDKAHLLCNTAISLGCRNSGITLGKNQKFLVAVRSTSSMEVPVHCGNRFELGESYYQFLTDESNRRMEENIQKLDRFTLEIKSIML